MMACIVDLQTKKILLTTNLTETCRRIAELTTTLSSNMGSEGSVYEGLSTLMQEHKMLLERRMKVSSDIAAAEKTLKNFESRAQAPAQPHFSATLLTDIIGTTLSQHITMCYFLNGSNLNYGSNLNCMHFIFFCFSPD